MRLHLLINNINRIYTKHRCIHDVSLRWDMDNYFHYHTKIKSDAEINKKSSQIKNLNRFEQYADKV